MICRQVFQTITNSLQQSPTKLLATVPNRWSLLAFAVSLKAPRPIWGTVLDEDLYIGKKGSADTGSLEHFCFAFHYFYIILYGQARTILSHFSAVNRMWSTYTPHLETRIFVSTFNFYVRPILPSSNMIGIVSMLKKTSVALFRKEKTMLLR